MKLILFGEVAIWPLMWSMQIPNWIHQAHTEMNSWSNSSILWSSFFKNHTVLLKRCHLVLLQIPGCRCSHGFLASFEGGSDPMRMKMNKRLWKYQRSLNWELMYRGKHTPTYQELGNDIMSKTCDVCSVIYSKGRHMHIHRIPQNIVRPNYSGIIFLMN